MSRPRPRLSPLVIARELLLARELALALARELGFELGRGLGLGFAFGFAPARNATLERGRWPERGDGGPSTRGGAQRALRRAGLSGCLALALALLGCAGSGEEEPNLTDSYLGEPGAVLASAADLLRGQGYEIQELSAELGELQGEREERAARSDGSLTRDTVVRQQVLVDASAEGERTRVNALFTITWRRPTGERRSWPPESALSRRLRDRFYADLHRALGDAGAAAPRAAER